MSTYAQISIELKEGDIKSIGCHADGYLEGVGFTLFAHYQDVRKIKKLIKLGGLSTIGAEVDIPKGENHTFEKRLANVCTFYTRDRGEKLTISHYDDLKEYLSMADKHGYEYIYRVKEKAWFMLGQDGKLALLEEKLLHNESTFNQTIILSEKRGLEQDIKLHHDKHKKKLKV